MFNPTIPSRRLSSNRNIDPNSLHVVVFQIEDYYLAFPIEAVLKIITCPPIKTPIENGIGMINNNSETITIVDLRTKFINSDKNSQINNFPLQGFLIITQTRDRELCGFFVEKSPTLTYIPLDTIRPIPLSYRQVAGLSFASRMGFLPNELNTNSEPQTVFILG